jgi:hypothetical protein
VTNPAAGLIKGLYVEGSFVKGEEEHLPPRMRFSKGANNKNLTSICIDGCDEKMPTFWVDYTPPKMLTPFHAGL